MVMLGSRLSVDVDVSANSAASFRFNSKTDLTKPGRENWKPDKAAARCTNCDTKFSVIRRKHHCRGCGDIFCADCSKFEIEFTAQSRFNEDHYEEKKKRVCGVCHVRIYDAQMRWKDLWVKASESAESVLATKDMLDISLKSIPTDEIVVANLRAQLAEQDEVAVQLDKEYEKADQERQEAEGSWEDNQTYQGSVDEWGAYLVFSPHMHGVMYIVWSHMKVEGALAYGRPTSKVPAFKFSRDGHWELHRNINGNRHEYCLAWAMFFKSCSKFKCEIVHLGSSADYVPLFPVSVFLHRAVNHTVHRIQPLEPFTFEDADAWAIVQSTTSSLDVACMPRELFMVAGNEGGAAIAVNF